MKTKPQNPYKPCRRRFGKKTCNGRFDLIDETKSNAILSCDKCDKELIMNIKEYNKLTKDIQKKKEEYIQRRVKRETSNIDETLTETTTSANEE